MTNNPIDAVPAIAVKNLTMTFGDFVANDNISFELRKGEIHCLLGENGAGKSTFAKCLYGACRPDKGSISINGVPAHFASPKDAIQFGIGMVHQHFVLVPTMSVVENIIVGSETHGLSIGSKKAAAIIQQLCTKYGIELDPNAIVSELSVGEQQWVEILKTIYGGLEILILDEPTAALTQQESEKLFSIMRKMKEGGTSIIFITHKLNEVMDVSDRTTVFRKGQVVATLDTATTNQLALAQLMVGRKVRFEVEKQACVPGSDVLEIHDLHLVKENKQEALKGITLKVCRNEIVGIAGIGGNGQDELFDVIVGYRKATKGTILLCNEDITNQSPSAILGKGLASIPPDRINQGLLMDFDLKENLLLGYQRKKPFCSNYLLKENEIREHAKNLIKEYSISSSGPEEITSKLSGGNLQKLILARELSREVKCLVASCPTRGLDVGATEYVHNRLIELSETGAGVLLISDDLDEIFNVADRVAVIFRGEIMGSFPIHEISREDVGLLMAGSKEKAHPSHQDVEVNA